MVAGLKVGTLEGLSAVEVGFGPRGEAETVCAEVRV